MQNKKIQKFINENYIGFFDEFSELELNDIAQAMQDYADQQLAIDNVSQRSEQLEAAWKALESVGFTRGEEFDDDDINRLLGL